MGYLDFNTKPKPQTLGDDIGKGQLNLGHLGPALFLQLQLIQTHNHEGSESLQLKAEATPEAVRAYNPREREEHGVATWTGGAANSGSVVLSFGTAFLSAPEVYLVAADGTANIIVGIGSITTTGVTLYWKDSTGATHTTLDLHWLAKGR